MSASQEAGGSEMQVIHVDLERCVGHGKCYLIVPELMRPFDDDGHAEFYADPIDPADAKRFAKGQAAIDTCPEEAVSWRPAAGA